MATPQTLQSTRHLKPNTLTLALRPAAELIAGNGRLSEALRLNTVLQTTLDIQNLIKLFAEELGLQLAYDGLIYRHEAREIEVAFGKAGRHSCCYRLLVGEENYGEITLKRRRKFLESETQLMEHLLCGLLYPLRNALMYLDAVRAAHKDPLTGANNRAALDDILTREVELARRHRTALSMIVMDVDKFKSINDRYGHAAGDQIIKIFCQAVNRVIRKTDMLFRYGGEEFVVLMSNTGREGALLLAERIRREIAGMKAHIGDNAVPFTVSLGVASLHSAEDGQSLFDRADAALYQAKSSGRNCARLADTDVAATA
jgi:diguanylate cyclase (GGDEF)-like protein